MLAYIKYGYLEFIKYLKLNLIIAIELTALIIMSIFTVSTLNSQLRFYKPLKDELTETGIYLNAYMMSYQVSDENRIINDEDLIKRVPEVKNIESLNQFSLDINEARFEGKAYSKKIIDSFEPYLEEGVWFTDAKKEDGVLNVVVSYNIKNVDVGNEYEGTYTDIATNEYKTVKVKVVGKVRNGTSIFERAQGKDFSKVSAYDFFPSYVVQDYVITDESGEKQEITNRFVIACQEDLEEIGVQQHYHHTVFLNFDKNISKERLSEIKETLKVSGDVYDTEPMKENTYKMIRSKIVFLLPIIIGVLLFVIVTTICMSAINAKKQLRSYGIYYTCGSRWRQCILISAFSSLITEVIACILSALVLVLAQSFGLLEETVIELGLWQVVACVAVLVLNLITSVIMPIIIIGKTQPREIIKSNE